MNEKAIPTSLLLEQLKSSHRKTSLEAFTTLVYRFSASFLNYTRRTALSDADAISANHDTFLKMNTYRERYTRLQCACTHGCDCAERAAKRYLWQMHKRTIIDWLRRTMVPELEQLDEMWPAPDNCIWSPEAHLERMIRVEAILCAWNNLSDGDRQLLTYTLGPGRRNEAREQAIQQARFEAWTRFRTAVKAALGDEE